ncbi:anti-phage ZorAB system protein ZorA, partial [Mesorhizobium sp. M2A.F.Ca.ET.039.01.1.1]
VGPLIEQAMERAFSPVGTQIGTAIEQLKATSQSGLADMTKDFTAALQNGAGTEMRGVQDALREIQVSLVKTHEGMRGGGEDFSRRLSEAAENLNRLVSEAGTRLEGSAEQSRAGLADVVAAFKQTMDAANARIETELGNAASGASSKVEAAMGRVMDGLEGQVRNLMQGLTEFQSSSAADAKQTSDRLREAQEGMASSVTSASADAVNALQSGVANAFERISSEIDRFQAAMSRGESALSHQAIAITEASTQTRIVADAFSDTAQHIRSTSAPLLESADKMARATTELNASVGKTLSTMDASNQSAGLLAQSLTEQVAGLRQLWEGYRAQFDRVDQDLAKAVQVLGDATAAQADKLYSFTKQTDEGLGKAVSTLATIVSEIKENTSDLSDTIEQLAKSGRHIAAQ